MIPRAGRTEANFDLVIASQPYRAKSGVEFRAKRIIAPLARALRPGGRLIGIHSHGQDPGLEIIQAIWPGEKSFCRQPTRAIARGEIRAWRGRARPEFQRLRR
ncbi:MAG: class I SAM-dependent methyltransferase [Rhodopseudomonas palustris]|nr:class I SAM-dependent methyltransferase [Rhodopseudomonas palustris]